MPAELGRSLYLYIVVMCELAVDLDDGQVFDTCTSLRLFQPSLAAMAPDMVRRCADRWRGRIELGHDDFVRLELCLQQACTSQLPPQCRQNAPATGARQPHVAEQARLARKVPPCHKQDLLWPAAPLHRSCDSACAPPSCTPVTSCHHQTVQSGCLVCNHISSNLLLLFSSLFSLLLLHPPISHPFPKLPLHLSDSSTTPALATTPHPPST